jgi:hypothetical protein
MRFAPRMILITTLILGLAACYGVIKTPDATTASIYGPQISAGPLSPQKVTQLSNWLKAHDAGWRAWKGSSTAPITMAIVMHDASGQQTSLNLFESKDGTAVLYFYPPGSAQPLGRYLLQTDVAALRAAVGH